ncbi:MAG: aspartyl protease family protein [Cyclobacteriaceae bacterium]
MTLIRLPAILITLLLSFSALAQEQIGFSFDRGNRKVFVPFKRYNNLIVIPVKVKDQLTLNFVLDTGVQNAILTNKVYGDILQLEYDRQVIIRGPGEKDSIRVFVVDNIDLSLPGITGKNVPLVVLDEDFLKLSNNLGADVHGIIGYDLFSKFTVEVDYDNDVVVFHDPDRFNQRGYYKRIPISIEYTKPYMDAKILQKDGTEADVKLLIDLGASHALLLNPATSPNISIPGKNLDAVLGSGLGGEIYGKVGRVSNLQISNFNFSDVISFYPFEEHYGFGLRSGNRNGTVGGELLSHFNLIFDYKNELLLLNKSHAYKQDFEYDLSGLETMGFGKDYEIIMVKRVRENSPAAEAGLQRGDIIETVNGTPISQISLNYVNALIRSKPKKTINIRVKRGLEEFKVKFKLKRLI